MNIYTLLIVVGASTQKFSSIGVVVVAVVVVAFIMVAVVIVVGVV